MSALPNLITVLRILLVGPMSAFLLQGRYQEAMVIFIVAGLSDALDGLLARHYGWTSRMGAALDPLADKLLVAALIVILTFQAHIPIWLAVLIVGRDFIIMGGAGFYRLLFAEITFSPTLLSKANTVVQVVTLALLLMSLAYPDMLNGSVHRFVNPYCFWALAVLTGVSGIDYVVTWGRKALRRRSVQES